jgi:type IV pilus assembly protein PilA
MDRIYKMMKRDSKGFTLVELMVVLVIIGILVAIAIPIFNNVQLGAAQRAHDANLRTIDGAIMMYYAEKSEYPTTFAALSDYIESDLKVPEKLQATLGAEYGLSDTNPPKAAPGGTWDGAYNDDAKLPVTPE